MAFLKIKPRQLGEVIVDRRLREMGERERHKNAIKTTPYKQPMPYLVQSIVVYFVLDTTICRPVFFLFIICIVIKERWMR